MPDVDVRASGEHRYDVTVTSGEDQRQYRVTVPPAYLAALGAEDRNEPVLVRQAADILFLDLDAAADLPAEFSLDEVASAHRGLDERLRATLER